MPQFKRRGRELLRAGMRSGFCSTGILGVAAGFTRQPLSQGFRNLRSPGIVRLAWPVCAQSRVKVESFGLAFQSWAVVGQTKDSTGAPLGSMDVSLFRYEGNFALLSRSTSDGSGNYSLPAPDNAGPFYVVSFHPDGSLAGITRPILTATAV